MTVASSQSALAPAPPTRAGDVIDAHTHLFTVGLLEEVLSKEPPEAMKRFREGLKSRKWGRPGREQTLPDLTPGQTAAFYVDRLNAAGVSRRARPNCSKRSPRSMRWPRRGAA